MANSFFRLWSLILLYCRVGFLLSFGDTCGWETKRAYTDSAFEHTWETPRFTSLFNNQYGNNLHCEVTFKTHYDGDVIKVKVKETDLPPKGLNGFCSDKATFYDGANSNARVLAEVCGTDTPTITSSGSVMFMVFSSDDHSDGKYKGMQLAYRALDRGGRDLDWDRESSPGGGKSDQRMPRYIPFIVIGVVSFLVIVVFSITVFCRRRRAMRNQRQRHENAQTFHSPSNLNVAMANIQQQQQHQQQQQQQQQGYTQVPQHYIQQQGQGTQPGQPQHFTHSVATVMFTDPNTNQPLVPPQNNQGPGRAEPSAPPTMNVPPPMYEDAVRGNMAQKE